MGVGSKWRPSPLLEMGGDSTGDALSMIGGRYSSKVAAVAWGGRYTGRGCAPLASGRMRYRGSWLFLDLDLE